MKEKIALDSAVVTGLVYGGITLHDFNAIMATAGGVIALLIGIFRLMIVIREWRAKK